MIAESKLQRWIALGLQRYAANPTLVRTVFHDDSQVGWPSDQGDGYLEDTAKLWLPGEYAGGTLLYGGVTYPILSHTESTLTVTGDLTHATDPDQLGYAISPPEVARFQSYLQQHVASNTFLVETAFAKLPAQMPAFTIRLERDAQTDAYEGDVSFHPLLDDGTEQFYTRRDIEGQYLISIWTTNREECLWLYAWLLNWFLISQDLLGRWGLYNTAMTGSDIDPLIQFLPNQTHARHFLFVAARQERALRVATPELITGMDIDLTLLYQQIQLRVGPLP